MKLNFCALLPFAGACPPARGRRALSGAPDHADRAVPGRRRRRCRRAHRRRQARRGARPAGRDRQSRRRGRRHRHASRRQGGAGRLHHRDGAYRHDVDQSDSLRQSGLRSAQGLHADRPDLVDADRADGASVISGEIGRRPDRPAPRRNRASSISARRRPAPAAISRANCSSRWRASTSPSFRTRARRRSPTICSAVMCRSRSTCWRPRWAICSPVILRAIATAGPARTSLFPDVPTIHRIGAAGLRSRAALWAAGAGRHAEADRRAAQRRIAQARRLAGRARAHRGRRRRSAAVEPAEYAADIDREEAKWSALIKKLGLRVD